MKPIAKENKQEAASAGSGEEVSPKEPKVFSMADAIRKRNEEASGKTADEKNEKPAESADDIFSSIFQLEDDGKEKKPDASQLKDPDPDADTEDDAIQPTLKGRAAEQWEKIKASRDKWRTKFEELEGKVKSQPQDKETSEALEALKKERDELRSKLDIIDWEQSDNYRESFLAPIEAVSTKMAGILPEASEITPEQSRRLGMLSERLSAAAGVKGKKREFFDVVDVIVAEYIPTRSLAGAFERHAAELWDKSEAALSEREGRSKLSSEEIKKRRSAVSGTDENIQKEIDSIIAGFEASEIGTKRLDAWKQVPNGFNFNEFKKTGIEPIKSALAKFRATGELTPELRNVILVGSLAPLEAKEREYAINFMKKQQESIATLKKELEEAKKAAQRRGVNIEPGQGSQQSQSKSDKPFTGGSVLAEAIRRRASGN